MKRKMSNKKLFVLYTILRILIVLTAIRQIYRGNYESAAICVLSLILFMIPHFMEKRFKIEIPPVFEGIIYLFIFSAEILGEVNHFYVKIPAWDTMLHTMNGFLCAAIGFSLIYLLNRHSKSIQLSPLYLTLVAFCFSMTVGVCWEFFECAADLFLKQDMQKDFIVQSFQSVSLDDTNSQIAVPVTDILSTTIHTASGDIQVSGGYLDIGILDTMKDLFVNFLGAIVFSIFGFIYLHGKSEGKEGKGNIAASMMLKPADAEVSDEKIE